MRRENQNTGTGLLVMASIFLGIYSLALTLAPAARARSWDTAYPWNHWIGYLVWLAGYWTAHKQLERHLPGSNSLLLPVVALLNGWGLLTIWRLTPTFGYRQTLWLGLGLAVFTAGTRMPSDLGFLRRYKYLWLSGGLLLTALTLIFGTNPLGFGPRLWLGCCGLYLQPSEPLKLLLVVYLSAYFADWSGLLALKTTMYTSTQPTTRFTPQVQILVPTLIMTGLALLLLLVQRDLGTAFLFIYLYSTMVFLATGWRWVPVASAATMVGAGFLGYGVFDVIRLRVEAWFNPWLDPAGRSYQIVQTLISVANGGMIGRGPGLGSPTIVPVTHSDFIFSAIAEEGGLISVIGFLVVLGILARCGLRIAQQATDRFQRYLAAGLTSFLVAQSVLIIGGNLRLLPLTGVTLPFVSYGGSSLLVSMATLLLLVHISTSTNNGTLSQLKPPLGHTGQAAITALAAFLTLAILATGLVTGWWSYVRGPDLLTRTDNPRRAITDRSVLRGSLLDRQASPLAETIGSPGELVRIVRYPDLGPIIGYNHPTYGQSGLEASLDTILRGEEGNDPFTIWWNHLLYGQPLAGLDIRLTLDLNLQRIADDLIKGRTGALILLNAEDGEILAITSHPTYNPNNLDDEWETLVQDPGSPLLNRATQGSYPTGSLGDFPFVQAAARTEISTISLKLPMASTDFPSESTPLEIALAAAAVSNNGILPAPRIAQLRANPMGGWMLMPVDIEGVEIFDTAEADRTAQILAVEGSQTWQITSIPAGEDLTWYAGGTSPTWEGTPLALVLVLEEAEISLAEQIGQEVLASAMGTR